MYVRMYNITIVGMVCMCMYIAYQVMGSVFVWTCVCMYVHGTVYFMIAIWNFILL